MHPLNPDHPDYPELRLAGRVTRSYRPLGETLCHEWVEDHTGTHYCELPAAYTIARSDREGVEQRLCDGHARNRLGHEVPFVSKAGARIYWIVSRVSCSSCDVAVTYRSNLDHDGRCDRCRP